MHESPNNVNRLGLLLVLALCALSGCVHRRVTIRSNPPGAQLLVGDR